MKLNQDRKPSLDFTQTRTRTDTPRVPTDAPYSGTRAWPKPKERHLQTRDALVSDAVLDLPPDSSLGELQTDVYRDVLQSICIQACACVEGSAF